MDEADVLVTKINEWVHLQKTCSEELTKLASELEGAVNAANVTNVVDSSALVLGAAALTAAGVLTVLTKGEPLPVMTAIGAAAVMASRTSLLTSVGSEAYSTSKSKGIMEETKRVLDELKSLEEELKNLMKSLKKKSCSSCDDDDDDDDGDILEMVMRSEARQHGMNLSGSISIRKVCEVREFNISRRIMANQVMLAASWAIILQALDREGGKRAASSVGKQAVAAAGYVAGGGSMDNETEARETLRKHGRALMISAEETEEEIKKIREALQKLYRIKSIMMNKDRSLVEKRELIAHAIKISPELVVKEWLKKNAESEDFFRLVDLCYFIKQKLREEWKKKNKEDQERRKIDLIFLAHGWIENVMIPAKCLLPLPSITDVLLYSPWNCRLSVNAAYGIATGRIQPEDRQFGCYQDPEEDVHCPYSIEDHVKFRLPGDWNYMSRCVDQLIPRIMVEPIRKHKDEAYKDFIALENYLGAPAADRYLIVYFASSIGQVPFVVVTLVLSLVLFFSKFEATVHLAACLGKYPEEAVMDEEYLKSQYAYTVDNTRMTVPWETLDSPVFNMFKAVFGDVVPSSNR